MMINSHIFHDVDPTFGDLKLFSEGDHFVSFIKTIIEDDPDSVKIWNLEEARN